MQAVSVDYGNDSDYTLFTTAETVYSDELDLGDRINFYVGVYCGLFFGVILMFCISSHVYVRVSTSSDIVYM